MEAVKLSQKSMNNFRHNLTKNMGKQIERIVEKCIKVLLRLGKTCMQYPRLEKKPKSNCFIFHT